MFRNLKSFSIPHVYLHRKSDEKSKKAQIKSSKSLLIINSFFLSLYTLTNLASIYSMEKSNEENIKDNPSFLSYKYLIFGQLFFFLVLILLKMMLFFNFKAATQFRNFTKIYENGCYVVIALVLIILLETELQLILEFNKNDNIAHVNLEYCYVLVSYLLFALGGKKKKVFLILMLAYFQIRKIYFLDISNIREYVHENLTIIFGVIIFFRKEHMERKKLYKSVEKKYLLLICKDIIDSFNIGVAIINKKNDYVFFNKYFQNEYLKNSDSLASTLIYNSKKDKESFESANFNLMNLKKDSIVTTPFKNMAGCEVSDRSNSEKYATSINNEKAPMNLDTEHQKLRLNTLQNNVDDKSNKSSDSKKKNMTFQNVVKNLLGSIPMTQSKINSKISLRKSLSNFGFLRSKTVKPENRTSSSKNESEKSMIWYDKSLKMKYYFFTDEKTKKKYSIILHQIYFLDQPAIMVSSRLFHDEMEKVYTKEINNFQSKLLGSISHELKTPTNGIISILEYLKNEEVISKDPKIINEYITPALNLMKVFSFTINDILDYSKFNRGDFNLRFSEIDLPSLIIETFKLVFDDQIKNNIRLKYTIDDHVPRKIFSDASRIRQIFLNLLSNAIKFQKGMITISITYSETESLIKINIQDNGNGLSEDAQSQLFKLQPTPAGMIGFGLTISNIIAKELNSKNLGIQVFSQENKGASFTFFVSNLKWKSEEDLLLDGTFRSRSRKTKSFDDLDANEAHDIQGKNERLCSFRKEKKYKFIESMDDNRQQTIKTSKAETDIIPGDVLSNLKKSINARKCFCSDILLVDDSNFNIFSMKLLLQKMGFIIDDASNGYVAIENITNKMKSSCCLKYKLILMDINMFPIDGLQTTKNIFEIWGEDEEKKTPILAWTANDEYILWKCKKKGMSGIIEKPTNLEKLKKTLINYIDSKSF